MERWVRTGSGFRAQGAVERKNPNGNPDVTDWFRLAGRDSRNFARERIGNVAMVGTDENIPGTAGSEKTYKPPLPPSSPTFAFCFHLVIFSLVFLRLESERVVRVGAWAQRLSERSKTG